LPFFQPPLLQIFLVSTVPAQMVIAIFLGTDLRVEDPTTALADDFPHSRVWPYPGELFFIIASAFPDFHIPNRSSTWNIPFFP